MTAHPETRFTCDRCGIEVNVPLQNTPIHARMAGPPDWTVVVVGSEPSAPAIHLCHMCSEMFRNFMALNTERGTA